MPTDMREDIIGAYSSGKAALKKMAATRPLSENFRLYYGSHLEGGKGIRYRGAEFEEDSKGRLTKMVKGSVLTADVSPEEAGAFED
jgi:hypothetical protein